MPFGNENGFLVRGTLFLGMTLAVGACDAESQLAEAPDSEPEVTQTQEPRPDTANGLDLAKLKNLSSIIRKGDVYPDVHSLLVMRDGELVFEAYFNGQTADDLHTMQSVSKSFTSAAVGIAIQGGYIDDVDEYVVDFFPQWRDFLITDSRRAAMQVADVLTMRTGTDYHENGPDSPHFQLNALFTGWDRFWLDRPMVSDPGTRWQYDSGGVIALSSMIKHRTGMHADAYLDGSLFESLDIRTSRWFRNSDGHPHTGGGLHLTPRDMIKLGQLYLQHGKWQGQQVVPEEWVSESIRKQHVFNPPVGTGRTTVGYGYLWWILSPDPDGAGQENIYAAMGFRAQYIFVIPEHDMVVGVTGWMPPAESGKPISFLYSDILPAVIR